MTPLEFLGAFCIGFGTCFGLMWWIGTADDEDDDEDGGTPVYQ